MIEKCRKKYDMFLFVAILYIVDSTSKHVAGKGIDIIKIR